MWWHFYPHEGIDEMEKKFREITHKNSIAIWQQTENIKHILLILHETKQKYSIETIYL